MYLFGTQRVSQPTWIVVFICCSGYDFTDDFLGLDDNAEKLFVFFNSTAATPNHGLITEGLDTRLLGVF